MKAKRERKKVKARKFKTVLRIIGWQNYMNGIVVDPKLFQLLSRKERKHYRNGQKAAMRAIKNNSQFHSILDSKLREINDAMAGAGSNTAHASSEHSEEAPIVGEHC